MRQLPLLGLALGILVLVAPALGHAVQVWGDEWNAPAALGKAA